MRTHTVIDSPIGPLTLINTDGVLSGLYMDRQAHRPAEARFGKRTDSGFDAIKEQLAEYFVGARTAFDLPLRPDGAAFDLSVWQKLPAIPYGATRSYGQIATELGDRSLAQAVGAAIGRNPLSIVVPCHRVIGANGALVGYAGGLKRKVYLLALENPTRATQQTFL
jgi:methylated-DNA-[protein]-cysteine S-methyltransferase